MHYIIKSRKHVNCHLLKGGIAMAIGKIEPINSTTPSASVSSVTTASKTLQNQIQMKQQAQKRQGTRLMRPGQPIQPNKRLGS